MRARAQEVTRGTALRSTMKALLYLFKFIIRSRQVQMRALLLRHDEEFHSELRVLFDAFSTMMQLHSPPDVLLTQPVCLQYFASIFPELEQVCPSCGGP